MEDKRFIEQVKKMLADDYGDDSITYYLREAGADPADIASFIETARSEYSRERGAKYTKSNKFYYYMWLALCIGSFIVFLFVLPLFQIAVGRIFILSFLGSLLCCVFAFHALAYRKTWSEEFVQKFGKPKIQYAFLVIMFIPGVVLHFIFSYRFSSAQDAILKDTQVEVVGHVVDGNSVEVKRLLRGGGAEFSSVVVEFETKEGQKITVSKDVPSYQFKNFYKGQELHLIYSKVNPRNIDLLTDESSIREFKNTEERDLEPNDLMRLVSVKQQDMGDELNKISYGWQYDQSKNVWINEKRQCAVIVDENGLRLIGKEDLNSTYPAYLNQNGFTMMNKEDADDLFHTGKKIFENMQFIVTVEAKVSQDEGHSVISVMRK